MHNFVSVHELQSFVGRFFLVTPTSQGSHATICTVGDGVEGRCPELFPKYWSESHFLMGINIHVYKEEDLNIEDLY